MRSAVRSALVLVLVACASQKPADDTGTDATPSTASSTETTTTTTTTTSSTNTTSTATTTSTTTTNPNSLIGAWRLTAVLGPSPVGFELSFDPEPACSIAVKPQGGAATLTQCTYAATATEFTFSDTDCAQVATYGYTLVADQLIVTLIDEPCTGREQIIAQTWTLFVPVP